MYFILFTKRTNVENCKVSEYWVTYWDSSLSKIFGGRLFRKIFASELESRWWRLYCWCFALYQKGNVYGYNYTTSRNTQRTDFKLPSCGGLHKNKNSQFNLLSSKLDANDIIVYHSFLPLLLFRLDCFFRFYSCLSSLPSFFTSTSYSFFF